MGAKPPHDDREEYASPEMTRVGDAQELTIGSTTPVADKGGDPSKGYYDASTDPTGPGGPFVQLDV